MYFLFCFTAPALDEEDAEGKTLYSEHDLEAHKFVVSGSVLFHILNCRAIHQNIGLNQGQC